MNSDDLALRESFYQRFSPWKYEEWPKFIEKDGEHAFDSMVANDQLWRSEGLRNTLRRLAWDVPDPTHNMDAPREYNSFEARNRELHPEWFRDEDEEISDEVDPVPEIHNTPQSQGPVQVVPTWVWIAAAIFLVIAFLIK